MKLRKMNVRRTALYGAIGGALFVAIQTYGTWNLGARLGVQDLGALIFGVVVGGLLAGLAAIVRNKLVG
jgi:membrane protein DedA with SNARE-associated domain